MPSGRKDIYGTPSRRLADPKVIKAEMGAAKNAAAAARLGGPRFTAEELLAREGTTNASGGRPIAKPASKPKQKPAVRDLQIVKGAAAAARARSNSSRGAGMGNMSDRDLQIVKGAAAAARARSNSSRGAGMGNMSDRDLQLVKSAAAKPKPKPAVLKIAPSKPAKSTQVIRTTTNMKSSPQTKKR